MKKAALSTIAFLWVILSAACVWAAPALPETIDMVDPEKMHSMDRVVMGADGTFRFAVDLGGNVVKIPLAKDVNRVINAWNSSNQAMFMIGAHEKLVGTAPNVTRSEWFNRLYPPIGKMYVAKGDGSYNIEEMMALKPDLVIVSSQSDYEVLAKAGFTVLNMLYVDHDQMKQSVKLLGDILGDPYSAKAQEFIAYLDGNIEKIYAVTSKIPDGQKLKGYHVRGSIMTTSGRKHLGDSWMRYAGLINSMHDVVEGVKDVGMEEIIAADPDVIFVGDLETGEIQKAILSDPKWASIKAVKNNRVYKNPTGVYYWDRNSTETALQILWVAKTSYPELFEDIDIEKETRWFYKNFYKYDIPDAELKGLLEGEGKPRPR